jgi:hypothetical protein
MASFMALSALLIGGALVCPTPALAQGQQPRNVAQPRPADRPQSGDIQKKSYLVILKKVKISATRPDGKNWDATRLPNLIVRINNLSDHTIKEFQSQEMKNVLAVTFDVEASRAAVGQQVWFEVVDHHAITKDTVIGRATLTVTEDMIKQKMIDLQFGSVEALRIEFREQK